MRNLILLVILITNLSSPVLGLEFLANKSDWKRLSVEEQHGFVMGYVEAYSMVYNGGSSENWEYRSEVDECLLEKDVHSSIMVEIVDKAFEEQSNADIAPGLLLTIGLNKLCEGWVG